MFLTVFHEEGRDRYKGFMMAMIAAVSLTVTFTKSNPLTRPEEISFVRTFIHLTRSLPGPPCAVTGSRPKRTFVRNGDYRAWSEGRNQIKGHSSSFTSTASWVRLLCLSEPSPPLTLLSDSPKRDWSPYSL